jgi:NAD(P)-dependent dehydrogenase (short-subunit alcohol dehydrogenase family)
MAEELVGRELAAQSRRQNIPWIPLKRLASPEDIAAGFSFLASNDASFITGVDLKIDGGLTARAFPSG